MFCYTKSVHSSSHTRGSFVLGHQIQCRTSLSMRLSSPDWKSAFRPFCTLIISSSCDEPWPSSSPLPDPASSEFGSWSTWAMYICCRRGNETEHVKFRFQKLGHLLSTKKMLSNSARRSVLELKIQDYLKNVLNRDECARTAALLDAEGHTEGPLSNPSTSWESI